MKKKLTISTICFITSLILSYFFKIKISESFINTLYTVSGIMFSIGMGVICTFNPEKVKNKAYLINIKSNLTKVQSSFFFYFLLLTASYSLYQIFPELSPVKISKYLIVDLSLFTPILAGSCILYFVVNFITIQKLSFRIAERTLDI